jgi:hypothetical protein
VQWQFETRGNPGLRNDFCRSLGNADNITLPINSNEADFLLGKPAAAAFPLTSYRYYEENRSEHIDARKINSSLRKMGAGDEIGLFGANPA